MKTYKRPETVAVIGPAAYMKGSGLGAEIDAHDYVVRINTGYELCDSLPDDFGRKTTHVYLNNGMHKRVEDYAIPEGVEVSKKQHITPQTNKPNRHESNTGLMAIIEFVLAGHKVKVYGMDFYAGAFDGWIPEPLMPRMESHPTVDRNKLYVGDEYRDTFFGRQIRDGDNLTLIHAGGLRDFRTFAQYQYAYGIETDEYLAEVIRKNIHRVNT